MPKTEKDKNSRAGQVIIRRFHLFFFNIHLSSLPHSLPPPPSPPHPPRRLSSRSYPPVMTRLADLILAHVPLPNVPYQYTSYVPGKTPMSTMPVVVTALAGYLAVIFGIREVQKSREAQKLNTLFRIHNLVLSGGSALLLALILEEIVPILWRDGPYAAICATSSWTPVCSFFTTRDGVFHVFDASWKSNVFFSLQRLEFYYMINYYFKYLELLDTVFLALKKKPLGMFFVDKGEKQLKLMSLQHSCMYSTILPRLPCASRN
jgi:hypothetical protein